MQGFPRNRYHDWNGFWNCVDSVLDHLKSIINDSGLTGTPIAGAILYSQGGNDFRGMVGYSAGIILAGTINIAIARMFVAKWKLVAKV
jgi:hypothetical protein